MPTCLDDRRQEIAGELETMRRWRRCRSGQAHEGAVRARRRAGQHQHAATVARSITTGTRQAQTPATVAEALSGEGRNETGAPRGFSGVCRRTVDNGADAVLSLEPSAISATDP
jgi:hypothetical protein